MFGLKQTIRGCQLTSRLFVFSSFFWIDHNPTSDLLLASELGPARSITRRMTLTLLVVLTLAAADIARAGMMAQMMGGMGGGGGGMPGMGGGGMQSMMQNMRPGSSKTN